MDQRLPEPAVTDWRGLCEELVQELERYQSDFPATTDKMAYRAMAADDVLIRARAALAQPEPEVVGAVEQIAQIVYERAMVAAADAASRQHWPSWAELPESDARTHAITTAQAILTSGGYSAWSETETAERPAVLTRWGRAGLADGPAVPEGREPASVVGEPSDEELLRIAAEAIDPYDKIGLGEYEAETECAVEAYGSELIAFARAVLARWGHPAPAPAEGERPRWSEGVCGDGAAILRDGVMMPIEEVIAELNRRPAPVPAGEVGELVAWIRRDGVDSGYADQWLRAADLLEQRQAAPVPVGKVEKLLALLDSEASDDEISRMLWSMTPADARRAADLLEQHHPAPVPVAERLPGPEDCDAEGFCWWFSPADPSAGTFGVAACWVLRKHEPEDDFRTHWLPATALPLPQGELEHG